MKKVILLLSVLLSITSYSQVQQTDYNLFQAKGWSKDIALFRSKAFLFQDALGVSIAEITGDSEITQQDKEVIPLFESKTIERILESQELPLYDGTVTAGVVELLKNPNDRQVIGTLKIPNMPKCDGAVTVTGDSMYPLIKSGDIVFFKTIKDIPQSIYYGNMYLISLDVEGDELVMVKYIQKGRDENHLLLVSQNQHHADKEVYIRQINAMALVKGNIRFNFTS